MKLNKSQRKELSKTLFDISKLVVVVIILNPDFAIGMRHRDDKEGRRFGRKKCAHTFSMQALFSDEDAPLFGGECHYYCKFRVKPFDV